MKKTLYFLALLLFIAASCGKSPQNGVVNGNKAQQDQKSPEKFSDDGANKPDAGAAKDKSQNQSLITLELKALNNSGQTGSATLKDEKGKTRVNINLASGNPSVKLQPAHIHAGKCPNPGAVRYALSDLVNGKSDTLLNANLQEILSNPAAIVIHKSKKETSVYVSCGEIDK